MQTHQSQQTLIITTPSPSLSRKIISKERNEKTNFWQHFKNTVDSRNVTRQEKKVIEQNY